MLGFALLLRRISAKMFVRDFYFPAVECFDLINNEIEFVFAFGVDGCDGRGWLCGTLRVF